MFFIFGISDKERLIKSQNMYTHNRCGKWGRIDIFVVETVLSLFFIPTFRWNRRFYAHFSCCNYTMELDSDLGKEILRNPNRNLTAKDLNDYQSYNREYKKPYCKNCGKELNGDFSYCPYCGMQVD